MFRNSLRPACALAARCAAFMLAAASTMQLVGCIPPPRMPTTAPATEHDRQEADAPLTCSDAAHCALLWRQAQFWAVEHSSYRLQMVTDTIIQTYGPIRGTHGWAFLITRQPGQAGKDVIDITPSCSGIRCPESHITVTARFKRYLRSAK